MPPSPPSDPETLRLIYEHVRGTPREQLRTQEVLDGKAERNLAAGGVILGLSALAGVADPGAVSATLIILAVVAFGVLAGLVLYQLDPLEYRVIDDAENAWNSQRGETAEDAMHALVCDAVAAYQVNDVYNRWKARRVRNQLCALAAEVGLVGLAAAASVAGL